MLDQSISAFCQAEQLNVFFSLYEPTAQLSAAADTSSPRDEKELWVQLIKTSEISQDNDYERSFYGYRTGLEPKGCILFSQFRILLAAWVFHVQWQVSRDMPVRSRIPTVCQTQEIQNWMGILFRKITNIRREM